MFSKTIIIGRLVQFPRFNTAKSGTSVCSFSVAVDTGYGEKKQTDWFAVTVFGKTAENCYRYLQKGSLVSVIGVVHLHTYQGKDGTNKASLELVGDSVTFLSSRQETQAMQGQSQEQVNPMPQPYQQYEYFGDVPANASNSVSAGDTVQNEDLPF